MRITIIHFKSNDPNNFSVVPITDCASVSKAQNLSCKITVPESQTMITNTGVTTLQESRQNKKGKIIKIDFSNDDFLLLYLQLNCIVSIVTP